MKKEVLYKSRSFSSCMKTAYILFNNNFVEILKHTCIPMLVCSIIMTITSMTTYTNIHEIVVTGSLSFCIINAICFLLLIGSSMWFFSTVMSTINEQSIFKNLKRCSALFSFLFVISLIILTIIGGVFFTLLLTGRLDNVLVWQIVAVLVSVIIGVLLILHLIMLPFYYLSMKYLNEKEIKFIKNFRKVMRRGYHYYGFIFAMQFFTLFVTSLLVLLIRIPVDIISVAKIYSDMGISFGDAPGIPSYFSILTISIGTITFFIILLVYIWVIFSQYYAYGSIENRERERANMKNIII